jgi:hypothetical protein
VTETAAMTACASLSCSDKLTAGSTITIVLLILVLLMLIIIFKT